MFIYTMRKDKKNFLIMVLLGEKMRGESADEAQSLGKLGKLGKLRIARTSSP